MNLYEITPIQDLVVKYTGRNKIPHNTYTTRAPLKSQYEWTNSFFVCASNEYNARLLALGNDYANNFVEPENILNSEVFSCNKIELDQERVIYVDEGAM